MRVTVVGGGVYAPVLCEQLARALPHERGEAVLVARDATRLEVIAHEANLRVRASKPGWSSHAERDLARSLDGATHVVLLVRVGGLAARAYDERFPAEHGVAGDEGLGPGGIANAWRTLPVLAGLAPALLASGASVWNLVAPLGITTRCLLEHGVRALGICELPIVTRERFACAPEELGYAGLNHVGWFWSRTSGARAALERAAAVDGPTLQRFGAAPLRYYYDVFDREAAARLGLSRPSDRARALQGLAALALTTFQREPGAWAPQRPTPWFDRAVVPMIAAAEGGSAYDAFVNVHNAASRCAFASREAVVELPARIDARGVHPRHDDGMPAPVMAWLSRVAEVERLAYEAARDRDEGLLRQALGALPVRLAHDTIDSLARAMTRGPGG